MRNPDLSKLIRAKGTDIIYEQAAIELEKLEKIYELYIKAGSDMSFMSDVGEILGDDVP